MGVDLDIVVVREHHLAGFATRTLDFRERRLELSVQRPSEVVTIGRTPFDF